MVLGKKAVVFTLIAILISVFLFLLYANEYTPKENALLPVVKNRIRILDRFNENFLQYASEAMDISSFKAMNGMVSYAGAHGFFANFESSFLECVENGTLGGDPCPDMANSTLPHWLDEITNRSRDKLGINVSYEILNIQTKQSVPFQVEVSLAMHYEIRDMFATVNRTIALKRLVGIEGLPDPLYAVLGTYNNTIKAASTREDKWDNDTLYFMLYNRTYRFHSDAPSLISRFEGQLINSSCCGMESMVNPNEALGDYQNKSFVDYLFWNSTAFCAGVPVQVVYTVNYPAYDPKFRMEPYHLAAYNIGSDTWVSGCS